jgi:hypothetical protein
MDATSTYAALHLLDRWRLALAQPQGEPLPELPATPGRVHQMPPPSTVEEDAQDLAAAAIWRELAADSEGGSID